MQVKDLIVTGDARIVGNLYSNGTGSAATLLNRSTAVNAADTNYTILMARGTSLHTADTNPSVNGAICWTYK